MLWGLTQTGYFCDTLHPSTAYICHKSCDGFYLPCTPPLVYNGVEDREASPGPGIKNRFRLGFSTSFCSDQEKPLNLSKPKFLICQMDIYLPDFVKLLQVCFEKHRVFYEGTVSF